jgi:D-sedoheptulose 7-phosphate isomerase
MNPNPLNATQATSVASYLAGIQSVAAKVDEQAVEQYCQMLFDIWLKRQRVLIYGNGGSAYTASHHVTDYVKTAAVDGAHRLDAISLCDNLGLMTALGNDVSYDETFVYPLETFGRPGDLAVAISCSGRSPNTVRACEWARQNGLKVAAITGFDGGRLGACADVHINIPSDNYGIIEDLQQSVGHIAAQALKRRVAAFVYARNEEGAA